MLQKFAEIVADARTKKSTKIITNRSVANASILAENLLTAAEERKSDVFIVSGELYIPVFEPLVKHARRLLDSEREIKIILTDPIGNLKEKLPMNSFFQLVYSHDNGDVQVYAAPDGEEAPTHFILVPHPEFGAYRVETCHDTKRAFANFNDSNGAMILAEEFSTLMASPGLDFSKPLSKIFKVENQEAELVAV